MNMFKLIFGKFIDSLIICERYYSISNKNANPLQVIGGDFLWVNVEFFLFCASYNNSTLPQ